MPRTSLKCTKCKRKFKMPAHLARHMNTIHATKRHKTTIAMAKKVKARVGRPKGVRSRVLGRPKRKIQLGRVQAWGEGSAGVIDAMQAYHGNLMAERDSLDAQIDAFARAMETLGTATPAKATRRRGAKKLGRPRGSGARPGSLKDHIVRVLRQTSRPMGPRDIGASVKKAGFKTKAKDITKAVSNTLPTLKGIKKVGFGMYQM